MADKPDGWQKHADQQRLAWLRLSYEQRLDWLENAKRFVAESLGAARRSPKKSP